MNDMLLDLPDSVMVNHVFLPKEDTLRIFLSLWTEEEAYVEFKETIAFCVYSMYDCIGMRAAKQNTEFFQTSLCRYFEKTPQQHGFQCYEFLDLDGLPEVLVVAKGYEFVKTGKISKQ